MPPVLVDDSNRPTALPDRQTFMSDLKLLTELKINRVSSYQWMQRLRYLTFDDSDEDDEACHQNCEHRSDSGETPESADTGCSSSSGPSHQSQQQTNTENGVQCEEARSIPMNDEEDDVELQQAIAMSLEQEQNPADLPDSDDEEAQLNYALKLSLQNDEGESNSIVEVASSSGREIPRDKTKSEQTQGPMSDQDCNFCKACVPFPTRSKSQRFRVIQFDTSDTEAVPIPCSHYIAVSYCCPTDSAGRSLDNTGTYSVRETLPDGRKIERKTRAPDYVIDRAVNTAIRTGKRLIWIDQECIIQDDPKEKAIGIQAMDMIYQLAWMTIGILNNCVVTSPEVEAVENVLQRYRSTKARTIPFPQSYPFLTYSSHITGFIANLINDRWNCRAWILQEMFTAGSRAMLLISKKDSLSWDDDYRVLSAPQFKVPGCINVPLDNIQTIFDAGLFFHECMIMTLDIRQLERETRDELERASADYLRVAGQTKTFHPRTVKTCHLSTKIFARGQNLFGIRRVCNAAVALTFLGTRMNSRPVDRLAVMANLCDYEIRLNLIEVETRFTSLTTCMVALALMNGDFSLMTPDIYRMGGCLDKTTGRFRLGTPDLAVRHDEFPSWALPFHRVLCFILSDTFKGGGAFTLRNSNWYTFRDSHLSTPGYLWSVDRCIDLTALRLACQGLWTEFTSSPLGHTRRVRSANQEDPDAEIDFKTNLGAVLVQGDKSAQEGLLEKHAMDASISFDMNTGFAALIWRKPELQMILAKIFWSIITYLHEVLGEVALANSIWFSIRAETFPCAAQPPSSSRGSKDYQDMPDEVGKILHAKPFHFNPLERTLHMGETRNDPMNYIWIIRRIIEDGNLWVGSCKCQPDRLPEVSQKSEKVSSSEPAYMESRVQKKQLLYQSLAMMLHKFNGSTCELPSVNTGACTTFMYLAGNGFITPEKELERGKRVSVFDVDGPCEIFTPFDSEVERLPRPECRSMRWCWVVERVPDKDVNANPAGDTNGQKDKDKGKARETTEDATSSEEPASPNEDRTYCGTFRVLDRVKGAWECMEEVPFRYEFV